MNRAGEASPSLLMSTRDDEGRKPLVSVAIATHQRAEHLPRLINALAAQSLSKAEFEVLLVDDGSTTETAAAIRELGPASGLQLHSLRIEPARGPAVARNVAWHEARADVIAFTDDDCAPAPEWLERGLEAMTSGNEILVGRTLPDPELPVGPFSRTIRNIDVNWIPACNVFYRRADLQAVGGFDEAFKLPIGEDTDLAFRVRSRFGREFRFVGDALVYHDVRPSRFIDAARESLGRTGAARFFKLHPDARSSLHRGIFWKPSHPKAIAAAAGIVLGLSHPAWLALLLPWIHYRTRVRRPPGHAPLVYASLPGVFVVDLLETLAMARGSARNRTLVL